MVGFVAGKPAPATGQVGYSWGQGSGWNKGDQHGQNSAKHLMVIIQGLNCPGHNLALLPKGLHEFLIQGKELQLELLLCPVPHFLTQVPHILMGHVF